MPIYRLYEVDGAGNFMAVVHLEAADDAECLANARRLQLTARCELWERARIVAVLDPHSQNQPTTKSGFVRISNTSSLNSLS